MQVLGGQRTTLLGFCAPAASIVSICLHFTTPKCFYVMAELTEGSRLGHVEEAVLLSDERAHNPDSLCRQRLCLECFTRVGCRGGERWGLLSLWSLSLCFIGLFSTWWISHLSLTQKQPVGFFYGRHVNNLMKKNPVQYLRGILMAVHLQGVHEKSCDKHHTWGLLQFFPAILFSKSFHQPFTPLLRQIQRFNFKNLPIQGCKLGL